MSRRDDGDLMEYRRADLVALVVKLREALAEVVDGMPTHHLVEQNAPMTIERAREIRQLAGLEGDG